MKLAIAIISSIISMAAISSEFDRPWSNPEIALVIDPYAANSINWDALKDENRVVAVIHKSTIGLTGIDPKYFERKADAKRRGYLWGSYHWGVAGDPIKQADHYIDTVKPSDNELIALDLEDVHSSKLMNADEAVLFIKRVKERTGRFPVLYTNHASAKYISQRLPDVAFKDSPLWYARFKPNVTDFPHGVWSTYTLWQFSSEILPQLRVPGTKSDMDINVL
ncbi:GH25 family lysozyme M1 (1,4-beta-N-acetylmuramidase) [Paraburkholderia sp. JPY158]|uniref:GH25 family lysozyme M1 (1,4-beta-N-acetylmuramidase) n=1 Tax=Paraburkholderia atlantica TaxID=2654982 RepID=A0A7W8QFP1_PARAM|nr:glycoside hydrolase family 25 protein [Paraburkholderia atlantica]MBB5429134.1 GH25 family lysozyme M1 (1,4-beta-N-acetylmuramidase) [Paraburkholderia atlantica]